MEIHEAKCDKCGKTKPMRSASFSSHNLPRGWTNVYLKWFVDKDICWSCRKKITKQVEALFK